MSRVQRTLLIVDDNPIVVASIAAMASSLRWRAVTASNGSDALELLASEAIDVVLVDYAMPEMTGIDMLQQMRDRGFDAPVILCSGYASPAANLESDRRPDFVLRKPCQVDEFQQTLEAAFAKSRLNDESPPAGPE